jgi:DNA-binding LacI/PurR family transcriptional regulator
MAAWPPYSLTTLRQPTSEMIGGTVELVQRLVRRPSDPPEVIRIPGRLIERGTTRFRDGD